MISCPSSAELRREAGPCSTYITGHQRVYLCGERPSLNQTLDKFNLFYVNTFTVDSELVSYY